DLIDPLRHQEFELLLDRGLVAEEEKAPLLAVVRRILEVGQRRSIGYPAPQNPARQSIRRPTLEGRVVARIDFADVSCEWAHQAVWIRASWREVGDRW